MIRPISSSFVALIFALQISPIALAGTVAGQSESTRQTVSEISNVLKGINSSWDAVSLILWIDELRDGSLTIGERFKLYAESELPGYVTYLYYDAEGNGTLMYGGEAKFVEGGRYRYIFPESGVLPVDEPIGRSTVFAFLSERKPDLASLGFQSGQNLMVLENPVQQVKRITQLFREDKINRFALKSTRFFVEAVEQSDKSRTRRILQVIADLGSVPAAIQKNDAEAAIEPDLTNTGDGKQLLNQARRGGSTFDEHIHFETGSSILSETGKKMLDVWADVLIELPETSKLVLIGHTDNRGSTAFNQTLSEQRADSARAYLTSKPEINSSRIKALGMGEEEQVVPNDSAERRRLNRRVEFVVR